MIHRRRNPTADWSPLSKSIFAEGIPKAVQIEPQPEAAGTGDTRPSATRQNAASASTE
jgi:hypothetical protein